MTISRLTFGLVTQLLDLASTGKEDQPEPASQTDPRPSSTAWDRIVEQLGALGVGAVAEEVTLGNDETVERFLDLQAAAHRPGLETFLRLRELTDEALQALRAQAIEAAAKLAPGEASPPSLRLMVDLGQPDPEDVARWLPRHGLTAPEAATPADGLGGGWGQALAFSLFAPDAASALRRLDQIADQLLEAAGRPGIEMPVWLAAFGVGDDGPGGSAAGVIQVAAHALSLGIERIFLAAGPEAGWWPADLRSPPPPLQAFRTLTHQLDGAARITRLTRGQYRIERWDETPRYLLWDSDDSARLPSDLGGPLHVTTALGETHAMEAERLRLTDEPIFVAPA
jgi:hypothetical protein